MRGDADVELDRTVSGQVLMEAEGDDLGGRCEEWGKLTLQVRDWR